MAAPQEQPTYPFDLFFNPNILLPGIRWSFKEYCTDAKLEEKKQARQRASAWYYMPLPTQYLPTPGSALLNRTSTPGVPRGTDSVLLGADNLPGTPAKRYYGDTLIQLTIET